MQTHAINWKIDSNESLENSEVQVYQYLEKLDISFIAYHHEASPTVEHISSLDEWIRGRHCKNLFLKNSKGDQLYMLIASYDKNVNLRAVARLIGSTRLSFAEPERMRSYLGLEPGSVSPFGLINDVAHHVEVLLDADLQTYEWINFHPNVSTATISIAYADFKCYLNACGNKWQTIALDSMAI
jgi:Ala-tRNA(Pro) deacylase